MDNTNHHPTGSQPEDRQAGQPGYQQPVPVAQQTPPNMKPCRRCAQPIPAKAKTCMYCGAKQKKVPTWLIVVIVLLAFFSIIGAMGGGSDSPTPSASSSNSSSQQVEYEDVTLEDLASALGTNALNAKEAYQGKYIRITGHLSNIDSSGKYFVIDDGSGVGQLDGHGIQCSIKEDATLDKLRQASIGETLTVCGKVTNVGEVIGYMMDVDFIE